MLTTLFSSGKKSGIITPIIPYSFSLVNRNMEGGILHKIKLVARGGLATSFYGWLTATIVPYSS